MYLSQFILGTRGGNENARKGWVRLESSSSPSAPATLPPPPSTVPPATVPSPAVLLADGRRTLPVLQPLGCALLQLSQGSLRRGRRAHTPLCVCQIARRARVNHRESHWAGQRHVWQAGREHATRRELCFQCGQIQSRRYSVKPVTRRSFSCSECQVQYTPSVDTLDRENG
eukprot:scaffold133580_cov39-Tisochrysis_lutea.AAC.1